VTRVIEKGTLHARSVSVVMPSYNEKETIAEAIQRISDVLQDRLLEIIVVDDDSPDGTWRIVQDLEHPRCRVIRRQDKRGLASALADGTQAGRGDVIVWLDCDLGIPPEVIPRLVGELESHDIAIGSRYVPGGADTRPKLRAALSTIFNVYARLVLGSTVRDYTSGFAAVRRDVLERVPLSGTGFGDYFIDWAYRCVKEGYRIVEVPYAYGLRKAGASKTDSDLLTFARLGFSYGLRVLKIRMLG